MKPPVLFALLLLAPLATVQAGGDVRTKPNVLFIAVDDLTDWAALDVTDEEFGGDWLVSEWVGQQLQRRQEKPFFLACGIYRPHEPWFVPKKYFEPFPLETIQLPPGYREDDLDDVPAEGQRIARNRYFPHILEHDQWKQGIQGYLASIHFADAMFGRVLDALDRSPHHHPMNQTPPHPVRPGGVRCRVPGGIPRSGRTSSVNL